MKDSHATSDAAAKSRSNEPSTFRLVIRAEIIPEEAPQTARPHSYKRALALGVGSVAVLLALSWVGISVFRPDSPATPTMSEAAPGVEVHLPASAPAPGVAAPVAVAESPPQHATAGAGTASTAAASVDVSSVNTRSVDSAALRERDASPSPINEVIPDAPRSALQTIRGTVRVSVRVTIDKQGTVVVATSEDPGPSRYFERLAVEASRKWTFAPSEMDVPRDVLLRFNFTREGITGRADALR
jgi:TonB family protein